MGIFEEISKVEFWPEPGVRPRSAVVAMSGGVDSSFAALVLKRAGVELVGVHFKMGDFDELESDVPRCCSVEDARDARKVAALLGIPFYVLSVKEAFYREVMRPFAEAYARGETPNPCIWCNPRIKWKTLLKKARELGADAIATGHHARVIKDPGSGRVRLLRAVEAKKDQSYFLARLEREQLEHAVLPAGWFPKEMIREALSEAGLPVADKQESMDVCFVDKEGYPKAVERILGQETPAPGEIVDREGNVLGAHPGIHYFTFGQRKGLNIPASEPLYVIKIEPEKNRLVVGPRELTYSGEAALTDLHWISPPPQQGERCLIKVRYKTPLASAVVESIAENRIRIRFKKPQRAITPGQAGVIYRGLDVVGCGTFAIEEEQPRLRDESPRSDEASRVQEEAADG